MLDADASPYPVLLDVSRSLSRGPDRVVTGIDRAERAYLEFVLGYPEDVWGVARTRLGFLLMDRDGLQRLTRGLDGRDKAPTAPLTRILRPGRDPGQSDLVAMMRRHARLRVLPHKMAATLARVLPPEFRYVSVGHSASTVQVLSALPRPRTAQSWVMLHDAIPLTHPEFCRPESIPRFQALLDTTQQYAERILCPSTHTAETIEAVMCNGARHPEVSVHPLGLRSLIRQDDGPDPGDPFFLALGTFEPRKNLELLLRVWSEFAGAQPSASVPKLVIAGARGWASPEFFDSLEAHPLFGSHLLEMNGLSDGDIDSLFMRCRALLFPSRVEGFGFPPLEAARLGVPVLASDLPSLHETLGDYPVYLDPDDLCAWRKEILAHCSGSAPRRRPPVESPHDWATHFKSVFGRTVIDVSELGRRKQASS